MSFASCRAVGLDAIGNGRTGNWTIEADKRVGECTVSGASYSSSASRKDSESDMGVNWPRNKSPSPSSGTHDAEVMELQELVRVIEIGCGPVMVVMCQQSKRLTPLRMLVKWPVTCFGRV